MNVCLKCHPASVLLEDRNGLFCPLHGAAFEDTADVDDGDDNKVVYCLLAAGGLLSAPPAGLSGIGSRVVELPAPKLVSPAFVMGATPLSSA